MPRQALESPKGLISDATCRGREREREGERRERERGEEREERERESERNGMYRVTALKTGDH